MITSDRAFDLLVEACPSYWAATDLDRYVASFEEPDDPDLFVRVSAFSHHVVDLVGAGRLDEARAVFAIVEQLIDDGDEDTTELVELGLVESIQNIVSHTDVGADSSDIVPLLGPRAAEVWQAHDDLWRDAARWRHDGPRVEQIDYEAIADPNLRRYFQAHKRAMDDGALISASDIVHYQTELKNINPLMPAGPPKIPWPSVILGVVLALCLLLAIYRPW